MEGTESSDAHRRIFIYASNRIGDDTVKTSVMSLHDIDVSDFLSVLDTCEGNIYLVTHEGDKLNLKSKLSQLVGLTKLIQGGKITEAFVMCDNPVDESRLFRLNMFGEAEHSA